MLKQLKKFEGQTALDKLETLLTCTFLACSVLFRAFKGFLKTGCERHSCDEVLDKHSSPYLSTLAYE